MYTPKRFLMTKMTQSKCWRSCFTGWNPNALMWDVLFISFQHFLPHYLWSNFHKLLTVSSTGLSYPQIYIFAYAHLLPEMSSFIWQTSTLPNITMMTLPSSSNKDLGQFRHFGFHDGNWSFQMSWHRHCGHQYCIIQALYYLAIIYQILTIPFPSCLSVQ